MRLVAQCASPATQAMTTMVKASMQALLLLRIEAAPVWLAPG
jgi:hypothetical protein